MMVKFETGHDVEIGGEVGSSDGISFSKDAKGVFNVIVDYSVGWGVDRVFGAKFCKSVDDEVKISKMKSVWRFMAVYI